MLLIPTRRRVTRLGQLMASAVKAQTTARALLLVDAQDWQDNRDEYRRLLDEHPALPWAYRVTEAERMGPKVREAYATLPSTVAWVGVLSDDNVIVTEAWDRRLVAQLDGRNFVSCDDGWTARTIERAAGVTIFSRALVDRAFQFPLFPPGIDHLGTDDAWEAIGRKTGCWSIDLSVLIEHHHVLRDPSLADDTYRATYGDLTDIQTRWTGPECDDMIRRLQTFFRDVFPAVVERVLAYRRDTPPTPVPFDGAA